MDPDTNQLKFITSTVCKNIVQKVVTIVVFLKELMILLRGQSVIL